MYPLNKQPTEHQELDPDGRLDIVSVFATIQGEGPLTGTPAIFVRLAGCNLQCPNCDTDYTSNRKIHTVKEVMNRIEEARGSYKIDLVVLTGGEPFRQNINPLVKALVEGHRVQIETNGTLGFQRDIAILHPAVYIVCSPKTPKIDGCLSSIAMAFKYILEAGKVDSEDGLPSESLGMSGKPYRADSKVCPIYLQPQDDKDPTKNAANVKVCVESCMKFGYKMSLQTHKIMGVD